MPKKLLNAWKEDACQNCQEREKIIIREIGNKKRQKAPFSCHLILQKDHKGTEKNKENGSLDVSIKREENRLLPFLCNSSVQPGGVAEINHPAFKHSQWQHSSILARFPINLQFTFKTNNNSESCCLHKSNYRISRFFKNCNLQECKSYKLWSLSANLKSAILDMMQIKMSVLPSLNCNLSFD